MTDRLRNILLYIQDKHRKDLRVVGVISLVAAILFLVAAMFAGIQVSPLHIFLFMLGFPLLMSYGFVLLLCLSVWMHHVFIRIARFSAVGTLSASIEFSVLNVLFAITGITSGIYFTVFKTITFSLALINSYLLNKLWTFESEDKKIHTEFAKFFISNVVGLLLNVGVASFIVNIIGAPSGISATLWANIAVMIAVFIGMSWNFLSYRYIVFRPKK